MSDAILLSQVQARDSSEDDRKAEQLDKVAGLAKEKDARGGNKASAQCRPAGVSDSNFDLCKSDAKATRAVDESKGKQNVEVMCKSACLV